MSQWWSAFKSELFRPVPVGVSLAALVVVALGSDVIGGLMWGLLFFVGFAIKAAFDARNRSKRAFYESYAEERDLELTFDEGSPPPVTNLLSQGDDRYIDVFMVGTLPGDLPGLLALYTFEDHTYSRDGDVKVKRYPFTLVGHELTSVSPRLTELYCVPRLGRRFTDPLRDRRTELKRLELESEPLDKRYEIFYSPGDDDVWLRRLFIPSFITWVESDPPDDFYFEVTEEHLYAFVRGYYETAAELDALCEAAANVAHRLEGEAAESLAVAGES